MKVVVDKLPERPDKCSFSKYCADGMFQCKLTEGGQMCKMEFGLSCDKLGTVSEVNGSECDKLKEEDGRESE